MKSRHYVESTPTGRKYVTREEVGKETSAWAGAALFGALNDIFDLELDQSTSSIALRMNDRK